MLSMVLRAGYATAQQFTVDRAGDAVKEFVTEIDFSPGQQITFDLYLQSAGEPQNAGGFWLDFTSSTSDISYVRGGRALSDGSEGVFGPWRPDAGVIINEPAGPGTLLMQVLSLSGASPDGEGDIIIGQFCLQSTGVTDANVLITTIPTVATWTPINDDEIVPGSLLIHQMQTCTNDTECDDGVFCNGAEICDPEIGCQPGRYPCTDDETLYNGDETCDEATDQCVSSGTAEPSISIGASFSGCGLPMFIRFGIVEIQGIGTNFTALSVVKYDSPLVIQTSKLLNTTNQIITQFLLLMPSILVPEGHYPATVTVTVDAVSDSVHIPPCGQ
jgi:hypothetical protein